MIVCSCNRLTDAAIRAALARPNAPQSAREVYGSLGCQAKCGGCAGTINCLIKAAKLSREEGEVAAERRDAA